MRAVEHFRSCRTVVHADGHRIPPAAPTRAELDGSQGPVLVEFGATWCGIRQALQPAIAEALHEHPEAQHMKVADGRAQPLGRSFGVKLWPTLIALRMAWRSRGWCARRALNPSPTCSRPSTVNRGLDRSRAVKAHSKRQERGTEFTSSLLGSGLAKVNLCTLSPPLLDYGTGGGANESGHRAPPCGPGEAAGWRVSSSIESRY